MKQTAEKTQNGDTNLPALRPELRTGGAVSAIVPQDVEQAHRMATAIVRGRMAPKSYGDNIEGVMVAILHGMEVGMTPMAAVQSIAVINGMPTIWGDGALGLVLSSGLVEDIDEHMETTDDGAEIGAVCIIKRKGLKTPIVGRFTWDDATRAKLTKKQGPWQDYPRRMIKARARAFALRDGFADVLRGLHIREEVQDIPTLQPGADGTFEPRPRRNNYEDTPTVAPAASGIPEDESVEDAAEEETAEEETTEEVETEAAEDDDPAAQYRVALVNKPNAKIPDWLKFRGDVVALVRELGPEAVQHIEAANADAFETMAEKSKPHFDAMWREIGGVQAG